MYDPSEIVEPSGDSILDQMTAAAVSVVAAEPGLADGMSVEDLVELWGQYPSVSAFGSLGEVEEGVFLAGAVADVDVDGLSGHDRVHLLKAYARQVAHYQAQMLRTVVSIREAVEHETGGDIELAADAASSEVRAALRLTRRSAETLYGIAVDLHHRLPKVLTALQRGTLDMRRAQVICDSVAHLPSEEAVRVVDRVLENAGGLTSGQLRHRIRRLCMEINPDDAAERYHAGVEDRRVFTEQTELGTGNIMGLDLPALRVAAISDRVNRIAMSLRRDGDARTVDQLRADVMLDLLEGCEDYSDRRGRLEIRVELATLTRMMDRPAELSGFGPVVADIARQTARYLQSWEFTATQDGRPVMSGTTRRRPDAQTVREVRAVYPSCVFPGCRMPASACDLDHMRQWIEDGPSDPSNLVPLCRHDHRIRHTTGWTHQPDTDHHGWISPLGHRYETSLSPP